MYVYIYTQIYIYIYIYIYIHIYIFAPSARECSAFLGARARLDIYLNAYIHTITINKYVNA